MAKAKKKASRRSKATKKKTPVKAQKKSIAINQKAHWEAYQNLQKRVDKAWAKLQADVKRKAPPSVLIQNKNQLLLLLGECNYMARECMRFSSKVKRRR